MKKLLLSILLLLLTLCFAAACGDGERPPENSGGDFEDIGTEAGGETDQTESKLSIPDGLPERDFGGYTFNILSRTAIADYCEHVKDLTAEEETGDVLYDAVYKRTRTVEGRFNMNVKVTAIDAKDETAPSKTFERSVLAGENTYDMIIDHQIYFARITTNGSLCNWYDIPYIDLGKPWWVEDATKNLTVFGKSFFALSDLSFNAIDYTYCMYFNKRLFADYAIESPYEKVRQKKWTIDYVMQITKDVYKDLNSDGKADGGDLYGYASNLLSAANTYLWAFDNPVAKPDAEGSFVPVLNNEKTAAIIEKLYEFFFETPGAIVIDSDKRRFKYDGFWIDFHPRIFSDGRAALITGMFVDSIMNLRGMDDDYGFLPYPMYDEKQGKYFTMLDGHGPLMGVPVNVSDPERTGIIIEAMSAEGYKQVSPVYYDIALKTKFARDEESAEMIDIIMEGRTFDFGYMYDDFIGGGFLIQNMFNTAKPSSNFASYFEKIEPKLQKQYDKISGIYAKYGT